MWKSAAIMIALTAVHPAAAQDLDAGKTVARMCRNCHGLDGYAKIPIAPHIGGEPAAYIAAQLNAFKDGTRQHEMMSVVTASLNNQQIVDVARWYGAQTAVAVTPDDFDPDAAPETCVSCHGADGISLLDNAPNLAAETNIYIDTQLKAFRSGKRQHEIMSEVAAEMSDTEIRAAADWYASVGIEITSPE